VEVCNRNVSLSYLRRAAALLGAPLPNTQKTTTVTAHKGPHPDIKLTVHYPTSARGNVVTIDTMEYRHYRPYYREYGYDYAAVLWRRRPVGVRWASTMEAATGMAGRV